jgi:hypothetical protein
MTAAVTNRDLKVNANRRYGAPLGVRVPAAVSPRSGISVLGSPL